MNNEISQIKGNRITFKRNGETLEGTISEQYRKGFQGNVYIVIAKRNIFMIHETLEHGITISTEITELTPDKLYTFSCALAQNGYLKVYPKEEFLLNA